TVPDLSASLLATSAHDPCPWIAHPWLSNFASGAVARFRPDLKGVESWKLTIVNARGEAVASYQGHGEPPREIAWDGRSAGGAPPHLQLCARGSRQGWQQAELRGRRLHGERVSTRHAQRADPGVLGPSAAEPGPAPCGQRRRGGAVARRGRELAQPGAEPGSP